MDNVNPFKDLSGTPAPRILKFGTNIGYDHLYRVRKNQHPHIYHSLYLPIFFSLIKYFLSNISQVLLHLGF